MYTKKIDRFGREPYLSQSYAIIGNTISFNAVLYCISITFTTYIK